MQFSIAEFEILYTRCFPPAMKLAMSLLHDEDEARDVVQEVFLRLWESKAEVENLQAFILRSVRNACINYINRLETRQRICKGLTLETVTEDYDPVTRSEKVTIAMKLLLTTREQQIMNLIYKEKMSYKEAADSLGVSSAAINKTIVKALKKLRAHFNTTRI